MSKNKEKMLSMGLREVWCETGYLRIDKVVFLKYLLFTLHIIFIFYIYFTYFKC